MKTFVLYQISNRKPEDGMDNLLVVKRLREDTKERLGKRGYLFISEFEAKTKKEAQKTARRIFLGVAEKERDKLKEMDEEMIIKRKKEVNDYGEKKVS